MKFQKGDDRQYSIPEILRLLFARDPAFDRVDPEALRASLERERTSHTATGAGLRCY